MAIETKNPLKSKTVHYNTWVSTALYILHHYGIDIPDEIAPYAYSLIYGGGNLFLRFISKGKIGFKGASIDAKLKQFYEEYKILRTKVLVLYKAYMQLKKDVEALKNDKQSG